MGKDGGLRCAVVMARNAWVSGTIASAIREWAIVSNQQHGAMELPFRTDRGLSTPTRPPRRHGLRRELADTRRARVPPTAQEPSSQAARLQRSRHPRRTPVARPGSVPSFRAWCRWPVPRLLRRHFVTMGGWWTKLGDGHDNLNSHELPGIREHGRPAPEPVAARHDPQHHAGTIRPTLAPHHITALLSPPALALPVYRCIHSLLPTARCPTLAGRRRTARPLLPPAHPGLIADPP